MAKKLKGAEELLQAMGYEKIGGSREAQELKYTGDVDSNKIAETAADLVILDGELERIKSLVVYARDEHIPIILSIILQVRSHPTSIYAEAKFILDQYHPQGHLPVQRPATQGQSPPPRAQGSQQQHYATPPPQQFTPLQWQQPQPRSMQPHEQYPYPDSSAPNVDQRKKANQEPIDNHPKKLPLSEANVQGNNKKDGSDDYVNYTPRTLFSPPDPNDFPEPIVQSQSDLARLNLFGGDDGPCSMVDARSEQVGHSNHPYLNSLASTMGSPEYIAEFNKQAEDAWKVDTPTQEQALPNTAIANTVPNVSVGKASEEQIVDPAGGDTKYNNLVTQEWLNETASEDPYGYVNIGQPKDFKNYDKAAPEVKPKTEVSETLGRQQTNEPSPNLPNLDTPEPDTTRVQANDWKHNMYDYENTRQPGFKPTAKPRNKIGVEKSTTGSHVPTLTIETPCKPYTSPLSSLEHQSLSSDSESFLSANSQYPTTTTDTMPDNSGSQERDRSDDYENVSLNSSTQELFSTTYEYVPSEQPPSRPPDSLSPHTRSRTAAMSKGSPTTSGSSIVATPHSATALSPQSPDVAVSKKHLGAMLSNAVGRERSTTHTNLDKGPRSPVKSPLPTNVDGAWTCDYCTNLVFDGNICDVCSHARTTLV